MKDFPSSEVISAGIPLLKKRYIKHREVPLQRPQNVNK